MRDRLKKSWFDLLRELPVTDFDLGNEVANNLLASYSEPTRYYHNLHHIEEILSLLEEVSDLTQNISILKLSAWFHDRIYDPQRKDNEELSAIYAEKILNQLNIDSETIYLITAIVRSTKKHQPLLKSIDNSIFLDCDLAILGTTEARYLQYAQAIRKEYQHLNINDYCKGRIKVLNCFLNRQTIYYTDYFYSRLEQAARKNIQTEIEQISTH